MHYNEEKRVLVLTRLFSFSPTFTLLSVKRKDNFLETLQTSQNQTPTVKTHSVIASHHTHHVFMQFKELKLKWYWYSLFSFLWHHRALLSDRTGSSHLQSGFCKAKGKVSWNIANYTESNATQTTRSHYCYNIVTCFSKNWNEEKMVLVLTFFFLFIGAIARCFRTGCSHLQSGFCKVKGKVSWNIANYTVSNATQSTRSHCLTSHKPLCHYHTNHTEKKWYWYSPFFFFSKATFMGALPNAALSVLWSQLALTWTAP